MATARQAQEMVARFVSCLVFHVNSGGTQEAKAMWSAEVRQAAQQVATWGWSDAAVDDSLIRPVQDEMVVRFGPAEGLQLFFDFVAVFYGS